MKPIFILFAALFFIHVHAQDSTAKHGRLKITYIPKEQTSKDSIIPAGPNELYFNIGPMFSMLQGAFETNETNLTFMYKRAIKNSRFALRAGIAWKPEVGMTTGLYSNQSGNSGDWYFDETDSTRIKNVLDNGSVKKIQLNVGAEFRSKGKRRWSGFTGMDIVSGFYKKSCALYDIHEVLNSSGDWEMANNDSAMVMLDYKKSNNFYFGLSPKAGISYSFNPHWMISAQAAVLATLDFGNYFSRNQYGTAINQLKFTSFNFGFNGIIDEFNLVYRF